MINGPEPGHRTGAPRDGLRIPPGTAQGISSGAPVVFMITVELWLLGS